MGKYQALLFLVIFLSCNRTTEIVVPSSGVLITANCTFSEDDIWEVHLSESVSVLDTNRNAKSITQARVTIFDDFNNIDTLSFLGDRYFSKQKPTSNRYYNLKIDMPNTPSVFARDFLPKPVSDISGNVDTNNILVDYDALLIPTEYFAINISFKDNPDEKNYYRIKIFYYEKKKIKSDSIRIDSLFVNTTLRTNDPTVVRLNKEQPSILIDDMLFNGKTKSLTAFTYKSVFLNEQIDANKPLAEQKRQLELYLVVESLSENTFLYEKSYMTQQFNKVDPFAEPNNVHSNIKNGVGIFGGYQRKRIRLL